MINFFGLINNNYHINFMVYNVSLIIILILYIIYLHISYGIIVIVYDSIYDDDVRHELFIS